MKLQKLSLIAALAVAGLLVSANLSQAQDASQGKKRGGRSPQEQVDRMSTELKLTADQKTKVTAILEDQRKQRSTLRDLSGDERREKARALAKDTEKKLKEVLTSEQWEKWQKMREEARKKGGGRKSGKDNQ
jgi:protein CpxP